MYTVSLKLNMCPAKRETVFSKPIDSYTHATHNKVENRLARERKPGARRGAVDERTSARRARRSSGELSGSLAPAPPCEVAWAYCVLSADEQRQRNNWIGCTLHERWHAPPTPYLSSGETLRSNGFGVLTVTWHDMDGGRRDSFCGR